MAGEKAKVIPLHSDPARVASRAKARATRTATGSAEEIADVIREFETRRGGPVEPAAGRSRASPTR